MSDPTAVPEITYQCRIAAGSPTIHLTTGTVDGKRGKTLCGLEEPLHPAEAAAVTCPVCRDGLDATASTE